ncbi:MAG: LysR family transcriptional regulator [Enterococcus sp.]
MIEWIKTFLLVYETRNFSTTAQKLYISQPTVSLQIKKLESMLGIQLFHRNGKQTIVPTKEAQFLYPRLLKNMEHLTNTFSQVSQNKNFSIDCTIACSNTIAIYIMPKIVAALIQQFPNCNFSIQLMNSKEVVDAVEKNTASIGIFEKSLPTQFAKKEVLLKDELVLAGDPDCSVWLLREQHSGIRFVNDIYLKEHHLSPKTIYVNNNELLLKLLENHIGKSIISKLAVSANFHWEPLEDSSNYRNIFIIKNSANFSQEIADVYAWITSTTMIN